MAKPSVEALLAKMRPPPPSTAVGTVVEVPPSAMFNPSPGPAVSSTASPYGNKSSLPAPLETHRRARAAACEGDVGRAMELWKSALSRIDTSDPMQEELIAEIRFCRAEVLFTNGEPNQAKKEVNLVLDIYPAHIEALQLLSEIESSHQPTDEEVLELPGGVLALQAEAELASRDSFFQEAQSLYSEALERLETSFKAPRRPEDSPLLRAALLSGRAKAKLRLRKWDEALLDANLALAEDASHIEANTIVEEVRKGRVIDQQQRERGEALKNALHFKTLGNKQLSEGGVGSAIQSYSSGLEWVEGFPDDDESALDVRLALLGNRSQAYLKRKEWPLALADAQQVLQERPTNVKAQFRRAKALIELNRLLEAKADLQHLSEKEPANVDIVDSLRQVEEKLAGRPQQANATQAQAQEHLGKACVYREGDRVEVREDFGTQDGTDFHFGQLGVVVKARAGEDLIVEFGSATRRVNRRYIGKLRKVRQHQSQRNNDAISEGKQLLQRAAAFREDGSLFKALELAVTAVKLAEADLDQLCAHASSPAESSSWIRRRPVASLLLQPANTDLKPEEESSKIHAACEHLSCCFVEELLCRLGLHQFEHSAALAARYLKLRDWQAESSLSEIDSAFLQPCGSQGEDVVNVAASLACLAEASRLVSSDAATAADQGESGIRHLQRVPWPSAASALGSELHALRGRALMKLGREAESQSEMKRAAVLDPRRSPLTSLPP